MDLSAPIIVKGTVVIGGGGLGSYGMYELASRLFEEPDYSLLSQIENFGTSGDYLNSGGTFGYAFGRFMLDPNKNESFWSSKEKEVKAKEDTSLSTEFQVIKKTDSSYKSLPKVCEEVYKKPKTDAYGESDANNNKYKLGRDTWKYCSAIGSAPGKVNMRNDEYNEYTSKWGKESNNGDFLLRKDDEENTWNHLFKYMLNKDQLDSEKSKKLSDKFKDVKSGNDLSLVCHDAYKSVVKNDSDEYGNNAREYCVFDKGGTISKYPTKPS